MRITDLMEEKILQGQIKTSSTLRCDIFIMTRCTLYTWVQNTHDLPHQCYKQVSKIHWLYFITLSKVSCRHAAVNIVTQ